MEQQMITLVERAIEGNNEAIVQILDHYMKDILYFAMQRLNAQDAEDVAQEVAIIIFNKIHTLRNPERLVYWIVAIVHNVTVNYLKKHHKIKHVYLDSYDNDLLSTASSITNMESIPESHMEIAEMRGVIMEEIERLPKKQKVCLLYHCMHNFTRAEIAEVTGLTPRQVSTGLNYGKKTLKIRLEERLGKDLMLSIAPIGIVPVLAEMMRADQAAVVSSEWSAKITGTCVDHISKLPKPVPKKHLTKVRNGKVIAGVSSSAVALTAVVVMSVYSGGNKPNEVVIPPSPPAVTTEASTELTMSEQPIQTLVDMIGEDEAALLEGYTKGAVSEADWQDFLDHIGATVSQTAGELDFDYTVYRLEKQNKRLLLAEQRAMAGGSIRVVYVFGEKEDAPVKVTQFILQFDS